MPAYYSPEEGEFFQTFLTPSHCLRELERAVEPAAVVGGLRVGVEENIGGGGVGEDRRPIRRGRVRRGLDHQCAGL